MTIVTMPVTGGRKLVHGGGRETHEFETIFPIFLGGLCLVFFAVSCYLACSLEITCIAFIRFFLI